MDIEGIGHSSNTQESLLELQRIAKQEKASKANAVSGKPVAGSAKKLDRSENLQAARFDYGGRHFIVDPRNYEINVRGVYTPKGPLKDMNYFKKVGTSTQIYASTASFASVASQTSRAEVASQASQASTGSAASVVSVASQTSIASVVSIASLGSIANDRWDPLNFGLSRASTGNVDTVASRASVASRPDIAGGFTQGSVASIASQAAYYGQASVASRASIASGNYIELEVIAIRDTFSRLGVQTQPMILPQSNKTDGTSGISHTVDFTIPKYYKTPAASSREINTASQTSLSEGAYQATSENIAKIRETFDAKMDALRANANESELAVLKKSTSPLADLIAGLSTKSAFLTLKYIQQALNLLGR